MNVVFTDEQLMALKYILSGADNPRAIAGQLPPNLLDKVSKCKAPEEIFVDDITTVQDAINHLCFTTGTNRSVSVFLKALIISKPDIFHKLSEFVFAPASKRYFGKKTDTFKINSSTRELFADTSIEQKIYINHIAEHYFKLYAKSGSSKHSKRMEQWLNIADDNNKRSLVMTLASGKSSTAKKIAICYADKSTLPLLVTDINQGFPGWLLQKKLEDFEYIDNVSHEVVYLSGEKRVLRGVDAAQNIYRKENTKPMTLTYSVKKHYDLFMKKLK